MTPTEPRRAAIVFIFLTVVFDMLAIGLIVPVLPKLIKAFEGGNTAKAAEMMGIFGTVWALMQFVCSPILGALSDRFGRRPVILVSNFGLGFDYILMALAPSLWWLFAGRVISGITAASVPTAMAYIADVTPPEKRAGAYGMVGAAFGLGFVIGPAVGGLLGSMDPRLPFWAAAGLSLTNAMYGLFVLPESLPLDKRAAFSWMRANPVGSLQLLRSYPGLLGLTSVAFLSRLAHDVLPSTFVLYAGYRYGWGEREVGFTMAGVGVCASVVQGALVRPVVARIGERTTLLLGLTLGAVGFSIYGLAAEPKWFLAGVPIMALWGLSGPAVQGLMSRKVDPSAQGRLQGAVMSMGSLAGLIGPGLFTQTFATFIAHKEWHFPGAAFVLASLLLVSGAILAILVTSGAERVKPAQAVSPNDTASPKETAAAAAESES